MALAKFVDILDELHAMYHRRCFVAPDPLVFLYDYDDPADREIVALLASSLAYGRVSQILRSVAALLERIGPPRKFVQDNPPAAMRRRLAGFVHRFNTGLDVAELLGAVRKLLKTHRSLREVVAGGVARTDATALGGLEAMSAAMRNAGVRQGNFLLCDPRRGGACKRMNLMLRWLVRRDEVDVGGWERIGAEKLLVPLDTHMHRLCRSLGATSRRAADLRAAMEITEAFRAIAPGDPVRYDFSLTRLGIRREMPAEGFVKYFELRRAKIRGT